MITRPVPAPLLRFLTDQTVAIWSPGRINLIGEHTDYNDGFVLPAAIDHGLTFLLTKSNETYCRWEATDVNERTKFYIEEDRLTRNRTWAQYLRGVIKLLERRGHSIPSFNCVFASNLPIGAGLSSSAALTCGFTWGLNTLFSLGLTQRDTVLLAQATEQEFLGLQCGVMDQFANMSGRTDQLIHLDCRNLNHEYIPFDNQRYTLLLADSKVKHELAESGYNDRRRSCEEGVAILQKHYPEVKNLRDVTEEMLSAHRREIGPITYRRCLFVIKENKRVAETVAALRRSDFRRVGQLMYASHEGLSKRYQVSCRELDLLVSEARRLREVLGARMMGGGFGGCTINLVPVDEADIVSEILRRQYRKRTGIETQIYRFAIERGTQQIDLSAVRDGKTKTGSKD